MIRRAATVSLLCVTLVVAAFAQIPQSPNPADSTTRRFFIHLQEGFNGKQQVVVTVDGLEVYKATPKTSELTGLAALVSFTNAPAHPVVQFSIPSLNVNWSNRVDLASGVALGFALSANSQVRVLQSTNFFYD
jgi:hypothetical protein